MMLNFATLDLDNADTASPSPVLLLPATTYALPQRNA